MIGETYPSSTFIESLKESAVRAIIEEGTTQLVLDDDLSIMEIDMLDCTAEVVVRQANDPMQGDATFSIGSSSGSEHTTFVFFRHAALGSGLCPPILIPVEEIRNMMDVISL